MQLVSILISVHDNQMFNPSVSIIKLGIASNIIQIPKYNPNNTEKQNKSLKIVWRLSNIKFILSHISLPSFILYILISFCTIIISITRSTPVKVHIKQF